MKSLKAKAGWLLLLGSVAVLNGACGSSSSPTSSKSAVDETLLSSETFSIQDVKGQPQVRFVELGSATIVSVRDGLGRVESLRIEGRDDDVQVQRYENVDLAAGYPSEVQPVRIEWNTFRRYHSNLLASQTSRCRSSRLASVAHESVARPLAPVHVSIQALRGKSKPGFEVLLNLDLSSGRWVGLTVDRGASYAVEAVEYVALDLIQVRSGAASSVLVGTKESYELESACRVKYSERARKSAKEGASFDDATSAALDYQTALVNYVPQVFGGPRRALAASELRAHLASLPIQIPIEETNKQYSEPVSSEGY